MRRYSKRTSKTFRGGRGNSIGTVEIKTHSRKELKAGIEHHKIKADKDYAREKEIQKGKTKRAMYYSGATASSSASAGSAASQAASLSRGGTPTPEDERDNTNPGPNPNPKKVDPWAV